MERYHHELCSPRTKGASGEVAMTATDIDPRATLVQDVSAMLDEFLHNVENQIVELKTNIGVMVARLPEKRT